jgi:hypothetical protein
MYQVIFIIPIHRLAKFHWKITKNTGLRMWEWTFVNNLFTVVILPTSSYTFT